MAIKRTVLELIVGQNFKKYYRKTYEKDIMNFANVIYSISQTFRANSMF